MSRPVSHQDYVGLQRFYVHQAHAIDRGDARAWARTFTADGSFTSPSANGRIAGTEALERFAEDYAPVRGRTRLYRHWASQLDAHYEEDGSVNSISYGMLIAIDPGHPPCVLRTSIHRDRLVRTEAGWRVASRVIEPDVVPALAAAARHDDTPG